MDCGHGLSLAGVLQHAQHTISLQEEQEYNVMYKGENNSLVTLASGVSLLNGSSLHLWLGCSNKMCS